MAHDTTSIAGRNGASVGNADGLEGRGMMDTVAGTAQDAATRVMSAAGTVADKLPAAMNTAQGAVDQTAGALEELPNQALVVGTSFSLGLGLGMLLTGSNRLLVLLALAPAAAMAATLAGREGGIEGAVEAATRR